MAKTDDSLPDPNIEPEELLSVTYEWFMAVISKEGLTYSDLAGHYPIKPARGNQYILICYDYDRNSILTEALPYIADACIKRYQSDQCDTLTTSGHNTKLHIVVNESCDILKKTFLKQKISCQLVPPHIHRRNATEISIQTFKDRFIAGLWSTETKYPAQ